MSVNVGKWQRIHREFQVLSEQSIKPERDQRTLSRTETNRRNMENFLQLLHNKEFWLWNQKGHETYRVCDQCNERFYEKVWTEEIGTATYLRCDFAAECPQCKIKLHYNDNLILGNADCCFNHIVGLPVKERIDYDTRETFVDINPIYDWQKKVHDTFRSLLDWLYIKAGGLGATELKLRDIAHQATASYKWSKAQIPIVVGPKEYLAEKLIERLKDLFPFVFDTDKSTVKLNGCDIHTFASNNIKGLRSLKNPKETIIDEFDFFNVGEFPIVMGTIFRYIAKSGNVLRAISTPGEPLGFCQQLEDKPGRFNILKLHWTVGLNSIFTEREIAEQKTAPNFDQEYGLQYLGGIGNFFDPAVVDACVTDSYNPLIPNREAITIMGVDSGFSIGSKFSFVIISWWNYKMWVMLAEHHLNPLTSAMTEKMYDYRKKYYVDKILVDGSDPATIYAFKERLREYPIDYHTVDKEEYHKMIVEPVGFWKMPYEFLVNDKQILEEKALMIHPMFKDLIIAFKSAYVERKEFIKDKSTNNDILDGASMPLFRFRKKTIASLKR
jgi:hypothetical protein